MNVPGILLSGNHKEINTWRNDQKIIRTLQRRIDLISSEELKNIPGNNRIKKEYNIFMNSLIGNEYDNYPDW